LVQTGAFHQYLLDQPGNGSCLGNQADTGKTQRNSGQPLLALDGRGQCIEPLLMRAALLRGGTIDSGTGHNGQKSALQSLGV